MPIYSGDAELSATEAGINNDTLLDEDTKEIALPLGMIRETREIGTTGPIWKL